MSRFPGERRPVTVAAPLASAEFERCFQAILPNLMKYARSLARDQDVAQDLVQETALKAWTARSRFVAGTNFKAWCYRILRNCFLSQVRRQQVARTESRGDDLPDLPVAAAQEVALELKDVAGFWPRLSADQQRSLVLVALEGHSYEVAAAIDDVPLGTVKSRVARARQTLIAMLNGEPCPVTAEPMQPGEAIEEQVTIVQAVPVIPDASNQTQIEILRAWRERQRKGSLAIAA